MGFMDFLGGAAGGVTAGLDDLQQKQARDRAQALQDMQLYQQLGQGMVSAGQLEQAAKLQPGFHQALARLGITVPDTPIVGGTKKVTRTDPTQMVDQPGFVGPTAPGQGSVTKVPKSFTEYVKTFDNPQTDAALRGVFGMAPEKQIEVGAGSSLYDPRTKTFTTAPYPMQLAKIGSAEELARAKEQQQHDDLLLRLASQEHRTNITVNAANEREHERGSRAKTRLVQLPDGSWREVADGDKTTPPPPKGKVTTEVDMETKLTNLATKKFPAKFGYVDPATAAARSAFVHQGLIQWRGQQGGQHPTGGGKSTAFDQF